MTDPTDPTDPTGAANRSSSRDRRRRGTFWPLLPLVATLALGACDGEADPLVGSWESVALEGRTLAEQDVTEMRFEFTGDSLFMTSHMTTEEDTEEDTEVDRKRMPYEIEGDVIRLLPTSTVTGEKLRFQLNGDSLLVEGVDSEGTGDLRIRLRRVGSGAPIGRADGDPAPTAMERKPRESSDGLRLYLPEGTTVAEYFRSRRVLVAPFETPEEPPGSDGSGGTGTAEVQLVYPSVNVEGGSPRYPHVVRVRIPDGVPLALDEIHPSRAMLVLEETEEGDLVYDLVGTASVPYDERPFDFFGDKPEYLYWEAPPPTCRREPEPPDTLRVPEDFRIAFRRGPVRAGAAPDKGLVVEADGGYRITSTRTKSGLVRDRKVTELTSGTVSAARVRRIYAAVVGCEFFELEDGYRNPWIRDGIRSLLVVTAGGRTHSVHTHHRRVPRFDVLRSVLYRQVPAAGDHL